MTLQDVLAQVIAWLQREQLVSYRALNLYRAMDMTLWLPQAEAALAQSHT